MTETLAEIRSYAELVAALRARADHLEISRLAIDELAGLPRGLASKLLAPVPLKNFGPVTFGPTLQSMGLMLLLVEDEEMLRRIQHRFERRARTGLAGAGAAISSMQSQQRRKNRRFRCDSDFAKFMVNRRIATEQPQRRKAICRRAAQARWRAVKCAKRAALQQQPAVAA